MADEKKKENHFSHQFYIWAVIGQRHFQSQWFKNINRYLIGLGLGAIFYFRIFNMIIK